MRIGPAVFVAGILASTSVYACPDGYSNSDWGMCLPNAGGDGAKAWEKGKKEFQNAVNDFDAWIKTGKCGGDICDAFAAAVDFGKETIVDTGRGFEQAGKRLSEGKPLDAVWHLSTDHFRDASENAGKAAQRSRVLAAAGQVAATAYGGPAGAAAYTAWLTYETTGNLDASLRAGVIAGLASQGLESINAINLDGAQGVAARTVLTGALNGAAVAVAGGSDEEIRQAVGAGLTAALIREGYRELTQSDLEHERLRSSTKDAYCLAKVPPVEYVQGTVTSGCFGPPSAYKLAPDGNSVLMDGDTPAIDFPKLDPDRPHVGIWADGTEGKYDIVHENSQFMTGVSRVPGMNAMSLGHDVLTDKMNLDLLSYAGTAVNVGTIPPAIVMTYSGSGMVMQDTIRERYTRQHVGDEGATAQPAPNSSVPPASPSETPVPNDAQMMEVLHLICEPPQTNLNKFGGRTDILVRVSLGEALEGGGNRICDVGQRTGDQWYELGHAHHQINYCHKVAERIAILRKRNDFHCVGAVGVQADEIASDG